MDGFSVPGKDLINCVTEQWHQTAEHGAGGCTCHVQLTQVISILLTTVTAV